MRTVDVATLTQNIKEMCIEANHFLSEDMKTAFTKAEQQEKAPLGKQILQQLQQNMDIAGKDMIPICQDTGMAVVFLEVGQDVHLTGICGRLSAKICGEGSHLPGEYEG